MQLIRLKDKHDPQRQFPRQRAPHSDKGRAFTSAAVVPKIPAHWRNCQIIGPRAGRLMERRRIDYLQPVGNGAMLSYPTHTGIVNALFSPTPSGRSS
jgi:hypothetical protein